MTALPTGWSLSPLGKIASVQLGGNYRNVAAESTRPLIKMGNIARISMDTTKLEFIPDAEEVSEKHRLQYGDVLLNTRNTLDLVGKVSIWRDELPEAYYNSNILRLEFRREVCVDSRYFGFALNERSTIDRIRALATGTTSVAAIYTRDLLKLSMAVPPKGEQQLIVEAFEDVDALLRSLERLTAKKQEIQQGLMQQLLSGETRLPGFTGDWVATEAGEIASFRGGNGFPLKYQGARVGEYPFFKVSDMNNRGNELMMMRGNNHITVKTQKLMGSFVFPADAIVFAKVGAAIFLERKRILSQPSCLDNNMAAMLVDQKLADVRFVHYLLMNFSLSSLVATSALPSLNGSQLRSIPLKLPAHLDEQRAIANCLADADRELSFLAIQISKARKIKQGMMQELLTGRTRLITTGDTA